MCGYCFGDADQVDHILPWSHVHCDDEDNLVACCWLCNLIASNKVFNSFYHKQKYVQERRYKYLKKHPVALWLKSELKELGYRLRKDVMKNAIIVENKEEMKRIRDKLLSMELHVQTGRSLWSRGFRF